MDLIALKLATEFSPDALAALPEPKCHVDSFGTKKWQLPDGRLHRLDGPALEWADGDREWYVAGVRHRLDRPAVEEDDGSREWWVAGHPHRTDGPAQEDAQGTCVWWVDGERHRADGPAIMTGDGRLFWFWEGQMISTWALPAALWREAAVRTALVAVEDPGQQRAMALELFPTLAVDVRRVAVAEALADRDPELRLWGLRAASLVALDAPAGGSVPDDTAAGPKLLPTPRAR